MILTIELTSSRYRSKPARKWYGITSMMVKLVGIHGYRRLYSYGVANAHTLFIKYQGKLWSLQTSQAINPGDTFIEWTVKDLLHGPNHG